MKIEIDVSEHNECTASPYWMIIDPRMSEGIFPELPGDQKINFIANMVTGPFFSRDEAENALDASRHNFGKHATVWCCCAPRDSQYGRLVRF